MPLGLSSRCDCAASNTGGVCPLTSLVDDIIPTVVAATDLTGFYFSQSSFPGSVDDVPKTVVSFDESNLGNVEELPEIEFGDIEPSRRRRQAETMSELAPDPNLDFAQPRNASATYFFPPDYFLASQAFIPRWPTASGLTESEATDVCAERLFDSDIALNCSNYLGSYLGTAFEFCKADLQVSIRISTPCQFFTLSTCSILC